MTAASPNLHECVEMMRRADEAVERQPGAIAS